MAKGMRGGFGNSRPSGGNNMQQMLRQAQQMKAEMEKEQDMLAEMTFEATSGGGAVKVTLTGTKTLKEIEIKPDVVDPDDVEMLQDLIVAAVNEGLAAVDRETEDKLGKYTNGLPF